MSRTILPLLRSAKPLPSKSPTGSAVWRTFFPRTVDDVNFIFPGGKPDIKAHFLVRAACIGSGQARREILDWLPLKGDNLRSISAILVDRKGRRKTLDQRHKDDLLLVQVEWLEKFGMTVRSAAKFLCRSYPEIYKRNPENLRTRIQHLKSGRKPSV